MMLHRKGVIHCVCANTLYPAEAIQWNKCNLTRFSTNFKFEVFFWMLLRATENGWAGHMQPSGL